MALNDETRSVTVLGSTGSVGTSTIDLLAANRDLFRVRALVGGRNARLLAEQARRLGAERAVIHDSGSYRELAEHWPAQASRWQAGLRP